MAMTNVPRSYRTLIFLDKGSLLYAFQVIIIPLDASSKINKQLRRRRTVKRKVRPKIGHYDTTLFTRAVESIAIIL